MRISGSLLLGEAYTTPWAISIPSADRLGALLRVSGWVEGIAENEVTFRVQVQDEQEQVCEASIRLAILQRERIAQRITRKREAIVRRELYRAA